MAPPAPTYGLAAPGRFVGRTLELAALEDLLCPQDVRLVTLLGVGGSGKTRLALEAVARCAAQSAERIAIVDMAPLTSPQLVGQAIAHALGIREALSDAELVAALQTQPTLLVLDNFEHLLGAATLVYFLAMACPRLRVIVTSRAVLGVRGEYVFHVRPLSSDESVLLFIDRAQAADTRFVVGEGTEPVIAEICRMLDGLPLAIELAAARVRVLPPHALVTRLQPRLAVLTGGGLDRPLRHQAMRNTIDWSYRLLNDDHQSIFRRMSVFSGSWTLDAAVSATSRVECETLAVLGSLIDMSLIESVPTLSGQPRFRMLETIREFGSEQLSIRGERDEALSGLIQYLVQVCESDLGRTRGSAQAEWFAQVDLELDNIRVALAWAVASPRHIELGLRLAAFLHKFWKERGHWSEGRMWLERALEQADETDPALLAHALTVAGDLAHLQGDTARARQYLQRSLSLWRRQAPSRWLAVTLRLMARIALGDGQFSIARSLSHEALTTASSVDVRVEQGLALNVIGMIDHTVGDMSAAMLHYEEALSIMRKLDDLPGSAFILWEIGQVAESLGELDRASAAFADGLAISRTAGDRKEMARCLLGLARVAVRLDMDTASARSFASESVELFGAMGAEREIEQARALLASIEESRQQNVRVKPRRSDGLTEREAQIVNLIAEGASNADIGVQLTLSVRTVERHVENIYAKLHVQGRTARAAVAGYAVRSATGGSPTREHTTRPHG
jgi:non-specific serine/threonine protein kinase